MDLTDPRFWIAALQIIAIDIVLSVDNAVVIALACRRLAPAQRLKGILLGTAGAIGMRVALVYFAIGLLSLPCLKLLGAALLLWIGIKLLRPAGQEGGADVGSAAADTLLGAIRIVIVADVVMSVDNVIGIAAASEGNLGPAILGLLVSVPLIVFASQVVLRLMDRFPLVVVIGAGLIGWVAGYTAVTDPALKDWVEAHAQFLRWAAPLTGLLLVVGLGKLLAARKQTGTAPGIVSEPVRSREE